MHAVDKELKFEPELMYIATGSSFERHEFIVNFNWHIGFASVTRVDSQQLCHTGGYIDSDDEPGPVSFSQNEYENSFPVETGELWVTTYTVNERNVHFSILIRNTKAGRCLIRIEQDNGLTMAGHYTKDWKQHAWTVLRPSALGSTVHDKPLLEMYLHSDIGELYMGVYGKKISKFGSIDFTFRFQNPPAN